ncbi:MAG: threonine/serine dehydratase [Candidatus Korarchaeota archaeon NZ13-K]|nr:MAG: threonine/serine dehydratase [Candidatus Korarchaeota archaeon NZ13-K]
MGHATKSHPENGRFPSLRDVFRAKRVISRFLPRTPLLHSKSLSSDLGFDVYLKYECVLPTRAFKVRGMVYYVNVMGDRIRKGIVVASTGNFAQAAAYAASLAGLRSVIVMPHGVPENKVEAVRALGGEVVFHGNVFDESLDYAIEYSKKHDMTFVHSANEPLLFAGVGTMHLEVLEDLPDVSVVLNPIGGGSGACGAVIVYKAADPSIRVIGVQAEGASSFHQSLRSGRLVSTGRADTIAEGLATSRAYELPFEILRGRIDDVILVSDGEMVRAIRELYRRERILAEPAGAASLAAAMRIRGALEGEKVVLMVTGCNLRTDLLREVLG